MDSIPNSMIDFHKDFTAAALKGKFHYSLPENLKYSFFEFSREIGKLSTSIGFSSTATQFFVDKFSFPSWPQDFGRMERISGRGAWRHSWGLAGVRLGS
jgi:hypothetical protein